MRVHEILTAVSQEILESKVLPLIIAAAVILFVLELFFRFLLRRMRRRKEADGAKASEWGIRAAFVFLRFFCLFLLCIILISSVEFSPMTTIFLQTAGYVFLFLSFLCGILRLLTLLERRGSSVSESPFRFLPESLLKGSFRRLKVMMTLVLVSAFLWLFRRFFPPDIHSTWWMTVVLIADVLLLMVLLLIFINRLFSNLIRVFSQRPELAKVTILLKSLTAPAQIILITVSILWLKTLIEEGSVIVNYINPLVGTLAALSVFIFAFRIIEVLGSELSHLSEQDTNPLDKTFIELIRMLSRIALVVIGIIVIMKIITGKPLTTLLAGLGIGGIAIALAAQDSLKNFFGSIMIMSDKPFKIGERVIAAGYDGTIEAIGFRSTRIRTLTGHLVIVPNENMANSPIENIGKRPTIRRLTNITITYDTPPDKIEKALEIIKGILDNHEGMPEEFPPRVYFNEFNSDSLNLLMIYWYSPPVYWDFLRFTEEVNLKIMRAFEKEKIAFAFPTWTTYLDQEDGKSIKLELADSVDRSKQS